MTIHEEGVELVWRGSTAYIEDAHGRSVALIGAARVVDRLAKALYGVPDEAGDDNDDADVDHVLRDALEELYEAVEEFLEKGTPSARARLDDAMKDAWNVLG